MLDIETELDPAAASIAGHRGGALPAALQRITTACLLLVSEARDGQWTDFRLHTISSPSSEFELLMQLDGLLTDVAAADAAIATYNGARHDLPMIRRRAARHWMFGLPGLAAIEKLDHMDVMVRQSGPRRDRLPSLREACAGLGISTADPRAEAGTSLSPGVIKCQADVVATFILTLYELAIERQSEAVLLAGWEGLSAHLADIQPRSLHLEHFRNHPLLRAARKARIPAGSGGVGVDLTPSDLRNH